MFKSPVVGGRKQLVFVRTLSVTCFSNVFSNPVDFLALSPPGLKQQEVMLSGLVVVEWAFCKDLTQSTVEHCRSF